MPGEGPVSVHPTDRRAALLGVRYTPPSTCAGVADIRDHDSSRGGGGGGGLGVRGRGRAGAVAGVQKAIALRPDCPTAKGGAPGPHAHRNTARQATDGLWTEVCGRQKQSNDPRNNQHILHTPNIGRRGQRFPPEHRRPVRTPGGRQPAHLRGLHGTPSLSLGHHPPLCHATSAECEWQQRSPIALWSPINARNNTAHDLIPTHAHNRLQHRGLGEGSSAGGGGGAPAARPSQGRARQSWSTDPCRPSSVILCCCYPDTHTLNAVERWCIIANALDLFQ